VLASLGARLPFWMAARVTLASFLVSHVTPFDQPGFGPLAIAYAVANIASALPITPGGLGVVEVTLVAVTVGFGAPRPTAVLAVVGYRIVNYWLPLLPGTIAYLRLRLSPAKAGQARPRRRRPDDQRRWLYVYRPQMLANGAASVSTGPRWA
jgi:uncharacterized membrane protein YbhN (UPF0104 family)